MSIQPAQIMRTEFTASSGVEFECILRKAIHLLETEHSPDCTIFQWCSDWNLLRHEFLLGTFEELLSSVINHLDVESAQRYSALIMKICSIGPTHVILEVLSNSLHSKQPSFTVGESFRILSTIFNTEFLSRSVLAACKSLTEKSDIISFIQSIVSLPDKCANRFHNDVPEKFITEPFRTSLAQAIIYCLTESSKTQFEFTLLGELVGKLCVQGYACPLWKFLLQDFVCNPDLLMSRQLHRLLICIPSTYLESAILGLIRTAENADQLSIVLGNTVLDMAKLQLLMTDKIFLQKVLTSDSHRILYNVIGYLAASPGRLEMYRTTFSKVLRVWADSSHIRYTSLSQHRYMSEVVIVFHYYLNDSMIDNMRSELLSVLMSGVQSHLNQPDQVLRQLGLAVAELISPRLSADIEHKLKFEWTDRTEIDHLKQFMEPPHIEQTNLQPLQEKLSSVSARLENLNVTENSMSHQTQTSLDSDDDLDELEPLGSCEDVPRSKLSVPVYLRDCMHGLIEKDNVEKIEIGLKYSETIIKRNPAMTQEVAIEFSKLLLHLGDAYTLPNFTTYRHKAMVALLVIAPKLCAPWFGAQFYMRDYTIKQRLDVLEALSAAATELSTPEPKAKIEELKSDVNLTQSQSDVGWRKIVDERIKSKTRVFAHPSKETSRGTANRFADVATYFFFPLIKTGFTSEDGYCPLSVDNLIIVQYLIALGKIMAASLNSTSVYRMSQEMFNVIWIFRYHEESKIRRALLFAAAMIIFALPSTILADTFQRECLELKEWLEHLCATEIEQDMQQLTARTLNALLTSFKEGMEKNSEKPHSFKDITL